MAKWMLNIIVTLLLSNALLHGASANEFLPDYYAESGYSSNRVQESSAPVERVDPFSGGLMLSSIDMVIPGNGGMDIVIQRNYRSIANSLGYGDNYLGGRTTLGIGWDMHFGRVWATDGHTSCTTINQVATNLNPVFELPDGSRKVLANALSGKPYDLISKDRWVAKCGSTGAFVIYSPKGVKYEFGYYNNVQGTAKAFSVTKITDLNGNWIKFDYQPSGTHQFTIIDKITTNDGRVVTFSYFDSTLWTARLASITAGNRTITYSYASSSGSASGTSTGTSSGGTGLNPDAGSSGSSTLGYIEPQVSEFRFSAIPYYLLRSMVNDAHAGGLGGTSTSTSGSGLGGTSSGSSGTGLNPNGGTGSSDLGSGTSGGDTGTGLDPNGGTGSSDLGSGTSGGDTGTGLDPNGGTGSSDLGSGTSGGDTGTGLDPNGGTGSSDLGSGTSGGDTGTGLDPNGGTGSSDLGTGSTGGSTSGYDSLPEWRYVLVSVTNPMGKSWKYDYHSDSNTDGYASLKRAESVNGLISTYTYGSVYFHGYGVLGAVPTTVLTQKTLTDHGTNKAGEWNYSYTPGTSSYDVTTVVTPTGCDKYQHYGFNATGHGSVWKLGSLIKKQTFNATSCASSSLIQEETYSWAPQLISTQNDLQRQGLKVDENTYAAVLSAKTIFRDGSTYTTTYSNYDEYGNARRVVESGQEARTTDYTFYIDTNNWIINLPKTEVISGVAGTISRAYNSTGSLKSETRYGITTNYSYFSSGDLKTVKDALGRTTNTFSNYYRGVPRSETRLEGVSLSRTVDTFGNVLSETDGRGKTTHYSYDKLNRITKITTPRADNDITVSWTDNSNGMTRALTRGTFNDIQTFDGLGKLRARNVEGITISYKNDILGRRTFESNPNQSIGRSIQYDALNRPTVITHPDGNKLTNQYLAGNKVKTVNERNIATTYSYRSFGAPDDKSLITIQAPNSVTTSINRNKLGHMTSVSQGGVTRSYGYNTHYYLSSITNPETGTTTLGRDILGNLISQSINGSAATTYSYDNLNRLVSTNFPSDTPDETRSYDKNSNLTRVSKGSTQWNYSYDDNNNLTDERLAVSSSIYNIHYNYNGRDQLTNITYPSSLVVNYSPNDLGRPTQVSGFVNSVAYFPNGQLQTVHFANGQAGHFSQNNRLLPTGLSVAGRGVNVASLSYAYDGIGNIARITDNLNNSYNRSFSYDGLDRLISASGKWGTGTIAYNTRGDIVSKKMGGQSLNYTYSNSKLSSISGSKTYGFGYDQRGNVTNNGRHTFSYDYDNNLASVNGATPINYEYDGNRNRVSSNKEGSLTHSVYNLAGKLLFTQNMASGESSDYVYLNNQLIARRDMCGTDDSDSDGIPDCVEQRLKLNPNDSSDASLDSDNDSLTNLQEYQAGTNIYSADTDGDGISDSYEVAQGLDPLVDDSANSSGTTGLSNLQVYQAATSNSDSDSDGMIDWYELRYNLNPLANDASADPDNDGLTNLQEYQAHTDPHNNDTDGDGILDGNDDKPNLNIAALMSIISSLLN